jgi:transposase
MKMIELIPMVQDEKLSENYLREKGILKTFKNCEHCGSSKLGMIRSDRWKCYSCKAEWSRRRNSILSLVRMKYSEFLICLKCFEIEMTAERCSKELSIYLKTCEELFTEFRKCICDVPLEALNSFEEKIIGDIGSIGFQLIKNKISVLLPPQNMDNIDLALPITRKRIHNGPVVYYYEFSKVRKKINNICKSRSFSNFGTFWSFANPRLAAFRSSTPISLLLYFKELEFRYNNKERLFELILINISANYRVVR